MKKLSQLSTKHHLIIFLALFIMIGTRNMAYATSTIESRQVEDNKYANLDMHVLPFGATVKIGNNKYQVDNGILALNIPAGRHICEVSAKGYEKQSFTIAITKDLNSYTIVHNGSLKRFTKDTPLTIALRQKKTSTKHKVQFKTKTQRFTSVYQ